MVRPGKISWKLFNNKKKKRHQNLEDTDHAAGATDRATGTNVPVKGQPVDQKRVGSVKKGHSWFGGGRTGKKGNNKNSRNRHHNETFETVETEECDPPKSVAAAAATAATAASNGEVDTHQLELFPSLQGSVPEELEIGLRPTAASDDEFSSRAELLEIWHGADPGMEAVEATIVPKSCRSSSNNSNDVDNIFSSIRVSPFGEANIEGNTLSSGLASSSKTPDIPSVDPFPAFEEVEEIPKFWREGEETAISEVPKCKAVRFVGSESESLLVQDENANDVNSGFTPNFEQFGDSQSNNDFTNNAQEVDDDDLEPASETKSPTKVASGHSMVGSEEALDFPVSFPHLGTGTEEQHLLGALDSDPTGYLCADENGRAYPLDQKQPPESSFPVLAPSHASKCRKMYSENLFEPVPSSLQSVVSDGDDYSVSSDSGSIKWSPSDLASSGPESSTSATTEALCSVHSASGPRQSNNVSSMDNSSPSANVEPHSDDRGLECGRDSPEESYPNVETLSSEPNNKDDPIPEMKGPAESDFVEGPEVSDRSVSSEPNRTNNLSALGMSDNEKLKLVKRVSSVGHLSVGQYSGKSSWYETMSYNLFLCITDSTVSFFFSVKFRHCHTCTTKL